MKEILGYLPQNGAESSAILQWMERYGDQLLTRMPEGHLTAAGFIFNPERTKTLMIYHNIYRSWAWTGGHADGERDLLAVALREAQEETGAVCRPIDGIACSADILSVQAHVKRGQPVAAHVHLNLAFALECEEDAPLRIKPDENSGVAWLDLTDLPSKISPEDAALMLPIYEKIVRQYSSVRWPAQP